MKKEFLKMAGVENEKDFYKLFPTEEAFFGMYPEAKKLVQKRYGGLIKADYGFGVTSMSTMPLKQNDNIQTNASTRTSAAAPSPTAEQLAAINPNIARNPMFRTFSGNLKFNWGDPKNRNIFSYGLTKEKENPYYSHAGTLGLNNLFGPGRGKLNLTGTYTPKTGEYNAGFNFGLPSKRMIGEGDEAQPKSNFTAGFGIMQNPKGNIERKAEVKYNTRLGTKASDPTLSIGVNTGFKYGGGLIKAVGGFNVTDLSTKPSMDCSSGTCQMNTDDYSWIKQNQRQKQPKPTTPWQNITERKYVEEEYDKYKNEWENQYKNKYPGLTLDEFVAANRLSNYNRMNQPQYNDYFDDEGNQIEGMDQRVHQSQPYIKWARSTFNSPTPSVNAIMNYFQDNKLKKDDIKNFINQSYTFPKEHMVTPSYFRIGGGLSKFAPGGFTTVSTTTSSISAVKADMQRWKEEQASRYPGSSGAARSSTYVANTAVVDPALAQGVKVKQGETREQATARTNREIAEKKKKEAARRAAATRAHQNKEVQETQSRINESNENPLSGFGIFNPNNWTRENWAKSAIGDKMRLFPNDGGGWGRVFDDYVNPLRAIGSAADDMARAPLLAQQTNSNMPYVTSFGIPFVGGMIMGKSGFKFPGSKAASNPSLTGVTRSGMFNPRDFKQMVTNPKQYFTKPGQPHVPIGIDYDEIARMNSGTIGPFDQTARIYQWGPRPPARVVDWGKVGKKGAELGYLSGAGEKGAYLGNKKKRGGELEEFAPGGFATTFKTTKYPPLQADVDILNEGRQELLNWYTARVNHPDPRISNEAKQVLENFSKLPSDVSKGIEYKGVHYLIPQGLLGQYMPYDETIEIANPYLSIEEQLKKPGFGYINKNPELRDHYIKFHQLSRTKEPIKHEGKHRDLHKTVEPILDQYSDQIYSGFVKPEVYREHLYERVGKPDLSREAAGKWGEANFDRDARYAYDWMTGTGFPNFKVNKKGNVKNMKNSELYRALMELRTEYGIDPSKNTTAEDFKNIYEKTKKSYEDAKKAKDPEKRLRYEHFLDLFNIHGNDFEKLNNLNNLLVGEVSSSLPIADEGFTVTETTTEAKIIEMPEVVIKPKDLSWWDKMKIYGKIFANATNYFLHPKHTWDRMKGIAEYEQKHPLPLALQILDPTGISNYGNVKTAYEKFRDEKGKKGFGNDYLNALLFDLEVASSVPILGKATKIASGAIKGSRAAKGISKGSKVVKPNIAREVILKPITNIDRLTGANRLLPLPTSAPKILSSAVDLTNSFNRGRRWMTGLLGGIDYGLDALSTFGSQNQAGTIPGVGPVQPGYTTNQGKVEKVQDDSLYVDPKRGDQVLTVQLPDGRIVKMSTGSKAYEDLINRVDENSSMFDDKKNMYIIKQYKK